VNRPLVDVVELKDKTLLGTWLATDDATNVPGP